MSDPTPATPATQPAPSAPSNLPVIATQALAEVLNDIQTATPIYKDVTLFAAVLGPICAALAGHYALHLDPNALAGLIVGVAVAVAAWAKAKKDKQADISVAKVGALASSHDAQAARLPPAALGLLLCLGLIGLTGCAYLRPIPAAVDCVAKSAAPADIIKVIADLAGDNYVAAVVDGVAAGAAIYPCAVGLVEAELSAKASSSSAGSGGSPTVVEQALAAAGNADGHLVLMRIQALRAAGRLPACHYPAPVPNPAALPTPPAR